MYRRGVAAITVRTRFDASYPDALAMYCSDGRFTDAIEELLHSQGFPRLDTMTMPGGPALVELTSSSMAANEVARSSLTFLVTAHHIKHVVLVAHAGCGYYKHKYAWESPEAMLRRQMADLRGAERWVRGNHKNVDVSAFYAWTKDGTVSFERIGEPG